MKGKYSGKIIIVVGSLLLIPILLNFLLPLPRFTSILGDEKDWLSFFGSYLGAIIGAAISFIIMYMTLKYHKKEDQYRHEKEWLDDFRKLCEEYVSAHNVNFVISIVDKMPIDVYESYNHCSTYINQLMKEDIKLNLMLVDSEDEELMNLYDDLRKYQMLYRDMLLNVQSAILCVLNTKNKDETSQAVLDKDMMGEISSDELRKKLQDASDVHGLISFNQLHNVILGWLMGFEAVYKSMADSCVYYIGTKQKEINRIMNVK